MTVILQRRHAEMSVSRARKHHHDASTDGDGDEHNTIQQKIAVSREMTKLLQQRVNDLKDQCTRHW